MNKRLVTVFALVCLAIVASGCGILDLFQWSAAPTPTPTPTPRPTVPASQVFDLDELQDMDLRSGEVFGVRITQEFVSENVGDLAQSYEGVTFAGSEVTLLENIIRFKAQVTIEDVDATIKVTIEGRPVIVEGLAYLQIDDLRIGDDDSRGLGDIIIEKTIETALDDLATEHGIHIPLEEADELDAIELLDVRVLAGEMILSCRMR